MSSLKTFGIAILCIVILFALIFAANEFEIFGIKFWGVRKADANREVFENTQSYVEGKRQDLSRYHHEWNEAKDIQDKTAIEHLVREQFSSFPEDKIYNSELRSWLHDIMLK